MIQTKYYQQLQNFPNRLEKLARKYKNKKVVLYGCGKFFSYIQEEYDLSVLNIIAVSDKKYLMQKTLQFDENIGYNSISPEFIHTLEPDVVIITALQDMYVEKYFCEELFPKTRKKFRYTTLTKLTLSEKIRRSWAYD